MDSPQATIKNLKAEAKLWEDRYHANVQTMLYERQKFNEQNKRHIDVIYELNEKVSALEQYAESSQIFIQALQKQNEDLEKANGLLSRSVEAYERMLETEKRVSRVQKIKIHLPSRSTSSTGDSATSVSMHRIVTIKGQQLELDCGEEQASDGELTSDEEQSDDEKQSDGKEQSTHDEKQIYDEEQSTHDEELIYDAEQTYYEEHIYDEEETYEMEQTHGEEQTSNQEMIVDDEQTSDEEQSYDEDQISEKEHTSDEEETIDEETIDEETIDEETIDEEERSLRNIIAKNIRELGNVMTRIGALMKQLEEFE